MSSQTLILYLLLVAPFVLIYWVQSRVRRVFQEEDQFQNAAHMNGLEAARELLDQAGLHHVRLRIEGTGVFSNDFYDPVEKTLVLSDRIARRATVLAVGVAGHEVGHAIQDAEGYPLMRLRTGMGRWLLVFSAISPIAFIGGFLLGSVFLMWLAVGILALQVVFALVTLPVEFNASRRAIPLLERSKVVVVAEEAGIRRVLRAAALTYLVSVVVRVAVFLFWFIILAAAAGLRLPF
jgi:Zn-dependent membrane protease YugP